jgi:integrase
VIYVGLRLKHFDPARNLVIQHPNEVRTKFSKRINAFLLPIDSRLTNIVLDWFTYLNTDLLFGNDDPMFAKTAIGHDEDNCFTPLGLSKEFWSDSAPVRDIFRQSFTRANLPSFTPHSFRHMLVQIAFQRKLSPGQLRAWSLNLGHESLLTTLISYGTLSLEMQGQLIAQSTAMTPENQDMAEAVEIAKILRARNPRGV